MGGNGYGGYGGSGGLTTQRRIYAGIDRGFIFFDNSPGIPWKGLLDLEEKEDGYILESYYVDGKKIGRRHVSGNYSASITSYDDPLREITDLDQKFGISYRESFNMDGEEHYRLHIVHGVSIYKKSETKETVNNPGEATQFTYDVVSIDVDLSDEFTGSHLILDSSVVYEWVLRDIETILYGYPDGGARIPSIDEIFSIFEMMNLVIIDHGDGTWSAVGHDVMVNMLDATEFEISSPTAEYVEGEEYTYDVESLIRDERWLE